MKRIVIVGAGTGGTVLANRLVRALPSGWGVTVVEPTDVHLCQPGLLYLPLGARDEHRIVRARGATLRSGIEWVRAEVDAVDPDEKTLHLLGGGSIGWELLVIASGSRVRPDLMPGMIGEDWRQDVFDFYTLGGAQALREALATFREGRLVVAVPQSPIKCPVAPLELLFLTDELLRRRGDRNRVELVYATPHPGVFARSVASRTIAHLLDQRQIGLETGFACREIARDRREMIGSDGRRVGYDLLVSVPEHTGAAFVARSGVGDARAFVPVFEATLAARALPGVFAVGDATDLEAPKTGAVADVEAELLCENLVRIANGLEPLPTFDGHANGTVQLGGGESVTIDFDHDGEPLARQCGWTSLLERSRVAPFGKQAFRWLYWNVVLPGRAMPLERRKVSAAA